MINKGIRALIVVIVSCMLGIVGLMVSAGSSAASPTTVGIDFNTSDNTATSVGAISTCLEVVSGATYTVDVIVQNVPGDTDPTTPDGMVAGQFTFNSVAGNTITVRTATGGFIDQGAGIGSPPGGAAVDNTASSTLPNATGSDTAVASNNPAIGVSGASGSGFFVRLTATTPTVTQATTVPLTLTAVTLVDASANPIPVGVINGATLIIAPDGTTNCATLPSPSPSPSPSPTPTPPGNDDFTNATVISGLPFTNSQSTVGASLESGEPSLPCDPIGATVWYAFTPSSDMSIRADSFGSDFNTVLAAYTGASPATLTSIACNDDFGGTNQSQISFAASAGVTYYFQIGGFVGQQGNLVLNVAEFAPPINDNFTNATVIPGLPYTNGESTAGASLESGEPSSTCAPVSATVWYAFTPSRDISIRADTFGSDFDTVLAAYTGASPAALTPIACNDQFGGTNQSQISFAASAGVTYYFQIGGFVGQQGNLVFNMAEFVPLQIGVSIDPVGSVVPSTGVASISGLVTCSKSASADIFGSLQQQAGRVTIQGFFHTSLLCNGSTPWQATVTASNGRYAAGRANVSLSAFAFSEGETASASASATVRLTGSNPTSGCPRGGNDGFEAGLVDTNVIPCWTVVDQAGSSGSWCNQAGTVLPQGSCAGDFFTSVAAPPEGLQAAMTSQGGSGSHVLYRCGVLRSGTVSFELYLNNVAGAFSSPPSLDYLTFPNQQFRADLVSAAAMAANPFTVAPADVLVNLYQTKTGDPPVSGYNTITADASAFVRKDVCLRFVEVDNIFFFHAGVDAVSISLR